MQCFGGINCHYCMRRDAIVFTLLVLFSFISCKKEYSYDCQELKQAAFNNNTDRTKEIVLGYISSLSSKKYTQANLEELARVISQCDIAASVNCFDCIKTLPSQTEMRLAFSYNGVPIQKIINFSYSANDEIIALDMHD